MYTTYEYALIVVPVALYILLAGISDVPQPHSPGASPEWNIATIFLVAQAQSLYRMHIETTGRRISHPAIGLIASASLIIIVCAATNIQIGLKHHTARSLLSMWLLFALASAAFIGFVTGARILSVKARGVH